MSEYKQYNYNCLEAFLDDISTCPNHLRRSSISGDFDFCKTENLEEAYNVARHGIDVDKIEKQLKTIRETEHHELQAVEGVSGAVVHMSNFLEGVPENMIDFPLVESNKFIEIVADICENGGVGSNRLLNKAIGCAYLVDHLENMGYRVKFNVYFANSHGERQRYESILVTIKDFKEPMSIGQIAGCMHPSFLRRLIFLHV